MVENVSEQEFGLKKTLTRHLSNATDWLLAAMPGMRIIRTSLAVLICLMIGWFIPAISPYNAAIAAIVCMQPDLHMTLFTARHRVIGTIISGIYSYLIVLLFVDLLGINPLSLGFFVLIGIFILPLMHILAEVKMHESVAIAAVVYIVIGLNAAEANPLLESISRVIATLIGIAVALFINWLPVFDRWGQAMQLSKNRAAERLEAKKKQEDEST